MIYWAECFAHSYGGGYAVDTDPVKALRRARNNVAETARGERGSYVIEFPDDADVKLGGPWGGFSASVAPLRVVSRNKIARSVSDDQLLGRASA